MVLLAKPDGGVNLLFFSVSKIPNFSVHPRRLLEPLLVIPDFVKVALAPPGSAHVPNATSLMCLDSSGSTDVYVHRGRPASVCRFLLASEATSGSYLATPSGAIASAPAVARLHLPVSRVHVVLL